MAGFGSTATHNRAFVWSDGIGATSNSSGNNTFNVFSRGGTFIFTNNANTTGATLPAGLSAWAAVSDRNKKENITELDVDATLARVETLPIYEYNYIGSDPSLRCRGPMAQDWHELFPSGKDPLMIDTMDLDGVTLAAVKGLAARVREQDTVIAAQGDRIATLEGQIKTILAQR